MKPSAEVAAQGASPGRPTVRDRLRPMRRRRLFLTAALALLIPAAGPAACAGEPPSDQVRSEPTPAEPSPSEATPPEPAAAETAPSEPAPTDPAHSAPTLPQVVDTTFVPRVEDPEWPAGADAAPRVAIDEGHFNFHTLEGRYRHFAELLRRDGARVAAHAGRFDAVSLADVDVLVVSNALAERNAGAGGWTLPTPSAFDEREIDDLVAWVEQGGGLLLIADHMPFPGAAEALASRFGIRMSNGFALDEAVEAELGDTATAARAPAVFERARGEVASHPITDGRRPEERIDQVATFTGQAFTVEPAAEPDREGGAPGNRVSPLIVLPDGWVSVLPETAWVFAEETPREEAEGWLQAAAVERAAGRVAIFGEAALFTAQRASITGDAMGMNAGIARQNPQLILNVVRWLARAD